MKYIILLIFFSISLHASQGEYWQSLNWKQWECGPYKLYATSEVRFDHNVTQLSYLRISQNLAYRALPNLDLELHYSYLYVKSFGAPRYRNRNRLELEVNPIAPLTNSLTVRWRNRLEVIKEQSDPKIYTVLRHRTALIYSLDGKINSIRISDEIFYRFATNKVTQNRFIPLGVTIGPLDIYFMLRSTFSSNRWYRSYVFGSELSF